MATPDFAAPFTYIAGLSIAGMTSVYTLANAPDVVFGRDCPALLPDGVSSGNDTRQSFGAAGGAFYAAEFTIDYLYFHAVGDGSHVFASTLEEHLRNQQQYAP